MRESNHCFPNQNKACVCINTQMYDRRALDTAAPLPLFNSLTHLVYLTSTSPRIREIMTQDGGLERMVRMLHDYCMSPPPPENPATIYGLTPPNARPSKPAPVLNPTSFDKHAAYRFSLAFQCVVNVGVRGSEQIRTRVVQAGTLDVVGCVLEAWLASKGFAVGPSSSATGLPRETKEQRHARKLAQLEQRQREEAAQLQRALQRQLQMEESQRPREDDSMDISPSPLDSLSHASTPGANSDNDMSTDNSMATTPLGSGTPTGSVVIPNRDRSGTVLARPTTDNTTRSRSRAGDTDTSPSPVPSTDTSRPETETEDDGEPDADVDMDGPATERRPHRMSHSRHTVSIASNDPANDADAHIIINQGGGHADGVDDVEVAVDDGMVSLEANDDFAMGAPPGAPGAITEGLEVPRRRNTIDAPDVTPRAGFIGLPGETPTAMRTVHTQPGQATPIVQQRTNTIRTRHLDNPNAPMGANFGSRSGNNSHHARETESGPYRDEDVLFGLQLLAYLSKYPHVRQAFYKPRASFHPATVNYTNARYGTSSATPPPSAFSAREKEKMKEHASKESSSSSFLRPFPGSSSSASSSSATARGKERASACGGGGGGSVLPQTPIVTGSAAAGHAPSQVRQTNVFSLVERFTFKPSSTETELPNPPPRLPPEIQYWAGVIMRNACRKDDTRGGIRQCANMLCGRWESYPREFAKCRRCRKAKYCGKDCQSTAWSEGHRFWCSAKDADDDATGDPSTSSSAHHHGHHPSTRADNIPSGGIPVYHDGARVNAAVSPTTTTTTRLERRDRERTHRGDRGRASRAESDTSTVRSHTSTSTSTSTTTIRPSLASTPTTAASSSSSLSLPRAESGMTRDRTVQPAHGQRTVRTSRTATLTQQTAGGVAAAATAEREPIHANFLSFSMQGTGGQLLQQQQQQLQQQQQQQLQQLQQQYDSAGTSVRRRAETITPSTMGSPVVLGANGDGPPNVIPARPFMPSSPRVAGGSVVREAGGGGEWSVDPLLSSRSVVISDSGPAMGPVVVVRRGGNVSYRGRGASEDTDMVLG